MSSAKNNISNSMGIRGRIVGAIKKLLAKLGYELVYSRNKGIRLNVFNTSYHKTALLSYIIGVFDDENLKTDKRHTNRYTSFLIGEILNQMGYNVDVVDCGDKYEKDFSKYDLVIGLGPALDYVLENRTDASKTKVIWFGTGCNPLFSNAITIKRVKEFYKKSGKLLFASSRYIKEDYPLQHEVADWIILHGASFALSTYRKDNISTIHAPVFIYKSVQRDDKEWESAAKNYLWFGTGGAIHKGLDLVIDAFIQEKNGHLHICGNIESEGDFFDYYKPLIDSNSNITYHGFVDVSSDGFEKILKSCTFVIYPSASEGNSPSVITCMANGGLIPIVSKNADVDLNGLGIYIEELSVNAVIEAIKKSGKFKISELKQQSAELMKLTQHLNSFDYFKNDFKQKLQHAIATI